MLRQFFTLIVFMTLNLPGITAQGETQLYLFNIIKTPDNQYHVYGPKFLSGFNKAGYTNQPFFTPAGDILVSVRKAGETQNDIWLLSTAAKKCRQLTSTKANEYSPQLELAGDYYSVVRQVEGEPINQQVFQFHTYGGQYESLAADIKDVGYYAWLKPDALALYRIEGESNQLMMYTPDTHKSKRITTAIGRTLIADGKGSVYYIHKFSETYWYIKKYSETSTVIDVIAETPSKSEDFAIAPDGTFFMGKDQKLMYLSAEDHTAWKECADLSIYGIQHISRMAVSKDGKQLALVATKE
jgi:hypothetical protein